MTAEQPILSVQNLCTQFDTVDGIVHAVDGVSFDVNRGETVCIVGESGSGKTVTIESITRILPTPPGEITSGQVNFDGTDLTTLSEEEIRDYRGNRISHVFQNPQGSLNPVYTVGAQIEEAIHASREVSDEEARERATELLDEVGIPEAASRINDYPHEFSGGMQQRVVIAMALAGEPDLLIADEPTTALDVTIEAQILDLFMQIQEERDMSIIFVTHDLGVVAEIADRVIVMYASKIMEKADVYKIFENPSHPYTRALLRCLPGEGAIEPIEGSLPSLLDPPDGCRFANRCDHAIDECYLGNQPTLVPGDDPTHQVSCTLYEDGFEGTVFEEENAINSDSLESTDIEKEQ